MSLFVIVSVIAIISFFLWRKSRSEIYAMRETVEHTNEEKQVLMDFLHIATEDIAKGADKKTICRRLVRATAFSCGAMSACLYEKEGDILVPVAEEGLFPPLQRHIEKQSENTTRSDFLEDASTEEILPAENNVIADVFKTGKAIFIRKATNDSRIIQHEDDSLKIKTFMAVPVKMQNVVYGVLVVINSISGKNFTPTIFSLAKSLGEQGGLAIYNLEGMHARIAKSKMESDLRMARSIQRYLMPQELPKNKAFSIATTYIPHQLIGGDFYDIIDLPNGKTGVVVADASGKGVSAAILMAVSQSRLHNIAKEGLSPSETLKKLNAEIVHSIRIDMFITITFAVIDSDSSKLTIARAGHELPIIYRKNSDSCEEIRSDGMAVGLVDSELFDETIEDITIDFNSGDMLVLYTDGVTEAVNEQGEEYTTKALIEKIPEIAHKNVEKFNDAIISELNSFTGENSYSDDLTLVAIKKI